ncbi:putative peptide/nitrate transporter [Capsicum baccatum]|uniref:peptidylprolyl isomerase n=1 Tax=Capsicum baccatum TaxID=33114 RepID=A0A2G2V3A1_CAPBA|nr:putative peptide/nitrate transporter [Capsicum baccatum]
MGEPEKVNEVGGRGRKREEESSSEYCSDESSDFSIGYDSDDPAFEILEGKPDGKIWKQYYKEWEENKGFYISVHRGTSFIAGIQQVHDYLSDPKIKEEYAELCKLAIADFNSKNEVDNKRYVFEEIVNVNASHAAGTWYYFTFDARDTTIDATAADAIKTFQANVWHGLFDGTAEVSLCRLKKILSNEDEKKKKKKKKKSRHNGKQEVEQDKPSLVKSFDSGLVIEELSEGKPRGKKAFVGLKVFVLAAAGQAIKGFEIGVVGMRVGDKRRITIPPDLGYGDQGHGGVIPPDSWLVCVDHALSLHVMMRFRSESSDSIKFEDVAEDGDKDASIDDAFMKVAKILEEEEPRDESGTLKRPKKKKHHLNVTDEEENLIVIKGNIDSPLSDSEDEDGFSHRESKSKSVTSKKSDGIEDEDTHEEALNEKARGTDVDERKGLQRIVCENTSKTYDYQSDDNSVFFTTYQQRGANKAEKGNGWGGTAGAHPEHVEANNEPIDDDFSMYLPSPIPNSGGVGLLVFQLFVYPLVERIFGPVMVSRAGAVLSIPLLASYPYIALLSGFCLSIVLNCASLLKNVLSIKPFP